MKKTDPEYVRVQSEYTVINSECGSWLLIVKPERQITYHGFIDAIRSFLRDEDGMDESGPKPGEPVS